jgi:multiple sugar transport system substrate-binding protein
VEGNLLQPLEGMWTEADRADFYPPVIDAVTFNKHIYGLWFYNAWRGLYYDTAFLKEMGVAKPPANWNEFVEFAKAAKKANASAVMYPGSNTELTALHMISMYWGLGGNLVDETGKPAFFEGKNREAMEKVYALYRELVTSGAMPQSVSTMDENGIRPFFYTRETALVAQSSSSVTQIYTDQPALKGRVGAVNYPLPDGKVAVPILVGWTYGIFAKDEEKKKAAWKFISYITNKDNLGKLNEVQGQLPVRKSIWAERPFFSTDPLMKQFKGIFDSGGMRARDPVPIYPALSAALAQQMASVLAGTATPAKAVDAARDAVMAEYDRMKKR